MKDFLSKIAIVFLAVLVLVSSSFISIDTHYCSGKKVDSSFFGKAHLCKMDMVSCNKENTSVPIIKSTCCHDTNVSKPGKIFEKNNTISVNLEQNNFTPTLQFASISNLFAGFEIDNDHFKDYSPPLVTRDILILVQRFQI